MITGMERRLKDMEGILAILSIFVILLGIIFIFAYKNKKEFEKLEY
jgi:lipoprotein signal peptidase